MESGMVEHGSLDEFFASFAYKAKSDEKRAAEGLRRPIPPPDTPPPLSQTNSRETGGGGGRVRINNNNNKKKNSYGYDDPCCSSFIRVTVGDRTMVVSKYFPLPPGASNPVVLTKKEMERAARKRIIQGKKTPNPKAEEEVEEDKDRKKNKSQRSQLSAAEKKSDAYKRVVSSYNTWKPPFSCYNLLQECHSFDPWRVLIICMLLNITTGTQVRRVLPGLFLLCPDAKTTAIEIPEEEIEKVIKSLGLQRKRAKMIKQFSHEYLGSEWTHVTQLHGVGKYAADAYAIFCVGKPEAVVPQDHKLIKYWKFVCGKN